jgi:hypothetical protein
MYSTLIDILILIVNKKKFHLIPVLLFTLDGMEYVKATRTTHINKKYWFWVARARGGVTANDLRSWKLPEILPEILPACLVPLLWPQPF